MGGVEIAPKFVSYRDIGKKYLEKTDLWLPSRVTELPRVNLDWFTNSYKVNFYTFFKQYMEYFARMIIRTFAQAAAKYSPPNIGKSYIEERFYWRPIYNLVEMAKGLVKGSNGKPLHPTREDYAALRNGFKFKVVSTKYRQKRGTVLAYTKGINEAKRISRIENRGLTKYSWGGLMNTYNSQLIRKTMKGGGIPTNFGLPKERKEGLFKRRLLIETEMPPIFKRLQKKSPNIKKYRWGTAYWEEKGGFNINVKIQNNLAEVEKYCDLAMRQGVLAAGRQTRKLLRYLQDDTRDKIESMFNFDMAKVTRLTALTIIKKRK